MEHRIRLADEDRADKNNEEAQHYQGSRQIGPDLAYMRLLLVNVVLVGVPDTVDRGWVLVDTGLPGTASAIIAAAEHRFGEGSRPSAVVLTHGHFDHTGALEELAERWDTPIYAHINEFSYLNGVSAYPAPDPSVGGGLMPMLSPLFPKGPIDVSARLRPLPSDGTLPVLPEWRWVATPGHTPGHISLWRESDRTLIAGDAFITTNQESAYSVAVQELDLHGPPMYFTPDWNSARSSVRTLAALEPELAITGHGRPVRGADFRRALHRLADNFDRIAAPEHGIYVNA